MSTIKMLYLLRHGEAELGFGRYSDFDRKLTDNGIAQLKRLGKILEINAEKFDQILSSSALRTKMTTELIAEKISAERIFFEEVLYEAQTEIILRQLNSVSNDVNHLLLVGHNPGISALASYVTNGQFISMQPGMMAKIALEVDSWCMLGRETGSLMEILQ
ncbi:SixA phosphatase family protein [Mongoliibacter ruber]|uniref:Phosphohistidine phosphatase n=1 Tax=Mongoliibacter ruber TaxID=1750599 RepID=A0A2T0WUJ6_9BACT|nr:histidine phosphatase family protein [Mongoliibacter ruber]PRY90373.1 phosphohistidine phosphatase [Mongoliibacter ruber]